MLHFTRIGRTIRLITLCIQNQIKKLAEKHGVDPATILISWQVKRGVCVNTPIDRRIANMFPF